MKRDVRSKTFFYITFSFPKKIAPPGSPHRAPTERERERESENLRFQRPSPTVLQKSLVSEPYTYCPTEPTYREMPVSRTYFT
jgi:hypothetical protein